MKTATLTFDKAHVLQDVAGELGSHLSMISEVLGVDVSQRGSTLRLTVADERAEQLLKAEHLLSQLYELVEGGFALHTTDVDHALRIVERDTQASLSAFFADAVFVTPGRKPITPRTAGQREYARVLREYDIALGVGPAGTGKTFLAVASALAALLKGQVKRILLTRPAVEAGEKLGFLPGDLVEKVNPYLRPLYDALEHMLSAEKVARLLERGVIEVAPLAFMRGRTLDQAYVVLDEAQNTTVAQMKMFLTRLGTDSKMVITGDITQVDLPYRSRSGLLDALEVLVDVQGVGTCRLTPDDVVRHRLVSQIVAAYDRRDQQRNEPAASQEFVEPSKRGLGGESL